MPIGSQQCLEQDFRMVLDVVIDIPTVVKLSYRIEASLFSSTTFYGRKKKNNSKN